MNKQTKQTLVLVDYFVQLTAIENSQYITLLSSERKSGEMALNNLKTRPHYWGMTYTMLHVGIVFRKMDL